MFKEKSFYICPSGISKSRLAIFRKNIEKEKGELLETFEDPKKKPDIVLLDDSVEQERILKVLDIAKVGDAKFLRAPWLSQCIKTKKLADNDGYEVDVKNLIASNSSLNTSRKRIADESKDFSDTEDATAAQKKNMRSSISPLKKTKTTGTDGGSDQSGQTNLNELICEKLGVLAACYRSRNDPWRTLAYEKAINAIKNHPEPITTYQQARSIKGIGDHLAKKIEEIATSGGLQQSDEFQHDEKIMALNVLNNIWGVGPATAERLYNMGFKTLEDLRANEDKAQLTRQQKIGLKYFEELVERFSRSEAEKLVEIVLNAVADVDPNLIIVVGGSYRRGRETVGDLDFILTCKSDRSAENSLGKVVHRLTKEGYLTDNLVESSMEETHRKYMGIIKLKEEGHKHRRIDMIEVPYDEFATSLIYFTGPVQFTRFIYSKAKSIGWRLNAHGLRKDVVRQSGEVVHKGELVPTPTEESVFEALGMKYLSPEERDHVY